MKNKMSKHIKMWAISLGCVLLAQGITVSALKLGDPVVSETGSLVGDRSCLSPGDTVITTVPFSTDGFKFVENKAKLASLLGILNPELDSKGKPLPDRNPLKRFDSINNDSSELSLFFYYQKGRSRSMSSALPLTFPSDTCGNSYVQSVDEVVLVLAELRVKFPTIEAKKEAIATLGQPTTTNAGLVGALNLLQSYGEVLMSLTVFENPYAVGNPLAPVAKAFAMWVRIWTTVQSPVGQTLFQFGCRTSGSCDYILKRTLQYMDQLDISQINQKQLFINNPVLSPYGK
jgi:hypothetical protein